MLSSTTPPLRDIRRAVIFTQGKRAHLILQVYIAVQSYLADVVTRPTKTILPTHLATSVLVVLICFLRHARLRHQSFPHAAHQVCAYPHHSPKTKPASLPSLRLCCRCSICRRLLVFRLLEACRLTLVSMVVRVTHACVYTAKFRLHRLASASRSTLEFKFPSAFRKPSTIPVAEIAYISSGSSHSA